MARKLVIGLAGVAGCIVLFSVVVATRPPTFHVERSTTISAPPEKAFALVNDFHAWSSWSPWEKLDPQMQRSFAGTPSGPGAVYSWVGNKEVGEGRMTIEKSEPNSLVAIKLEFLKPFTATNQATFSFSSVPEGTKLTWAMDGRNNFMAKAIHMFMNMDKLVGSDFERGLAALKTQAESGANAAPAAANAAK